MNLIPLVQVWQVEKLLLILIFQKISTQCDDFHVINSTDDDPENVPESLTVNLRNDVETITPLSNVTEYRISIADSENTKIEEDNNDKITGNYHESEYQKKHRLGVRRHKIIVL